MSKERRRLVAVTIILGVLAGWLVWNMTTADAAVCTTGEITWEAGTPLWAPTLEAETLNVQIEGHFLWVQHEDNNRAVDGFDLEAGVLSTELFGEESGATVCEDGLVTLHRAPEAIVVDLVAVWNLDPALGIRFGAR